MRTSKISWKILTKVVILISLCFVFLINANAKQSKSSKSKQKETKANSEFIGYDQCLSCHEDYKESFKETKHMVLFNKSTSPAGCEICHGSGAKHVENPPADIFSFGGKDKDVIQRCLSCHKKTKETKNFNGSLHSKNNVSCIKCHSVHKSKNKSLLIKEQPKLCLSCHKEQNTQLSLPSRHPVKEGKVLCSDCHSPHKSLKQSFKEISVAKSCAKCHPEKPGPYKYPHNPVSENCMTCHQPHGSVNDDLLVARVPTLCISCHTTALDANHKSISGGEMDCVSCHKYIHGSNKNERLFY